MENNLISDDERRKEKEKMNRLMDSELRLRTIHELRSILQFHLKKIIYGFLKIKLQNCLIGIEVLFPNT